MKDKPQKEKRYRIAGSSEPGPDYVCSKCGAFHRRLWRSTNMFLNYIKLFCVDCATIDQKDEIARYAHLLDEHSTFIGDLVPARPTPEGDTFWGQTSGDVEWWYALPQYSELTKETELLRRERNRFVADHQIALRDYLGEVLKNRQKESPDWTELDGRANSSPKFIEMVADVERMIFNSGHALIRGDAAGVARVIVANLAHVHKLGPRS